MWVLQWLLMLKLINRRSTRRNTVWAIGLSLRTTGYAINPARDLGPRIVHSLLKRK
jgi:hypothetical protein